MRLLYYGKDGQLSVTADLADADAVRPYAILSHTWGADEEEVTFEDIAKNAGKNRLGYKKIQLCGEQAKRDGLQYFWVDTCCINKANKAEHSLAIRSMFRWYRDAARCYVYLPDVSIRYGEVAGQPQWNSEFRQCKWFMRGWTLQELLAPSVVEFFSRDWHRLGDRTSLKSKIHEVTSIPHDVLEGAPLFQSSIDERFRWIQNRHTKLREDAAYCLSGIFDVDMAPVYGEGTAEAFRRLHDKIRSQEESVRQREECLRDLRPTDPRNDKKRIEDTKGGLLEGSYRWVLENSSFQQWHNDPQSQLLWIKGDPGKGKTMLLCGIINELQKTVASTATVSYFFCQGTDSRINSATAVLRGLLYLLVTQQPALTTHLRKGYDHAGKSMFEDANAWVALTDVFADVLQDPDLITSYLVVDALDECVTDLPKLLRLVAKQSSTSSRVKWIVSSRNWPEIEEQLERAGHKVRLSLELNAESVSAAVTFFIQHKVCRLAQQKKYDEQTRGNVLRHLMLNANDTFLWAALVCQNLEKTATRNVRRKLESLPPGLDALYERMMQQIRMSDDAELCTQVLASIALVYRPITLDELAALAKPLENITNITEVREIVGLCGSFLTLRGDTVYFVHQSAKDFLFEKAFDEVFPVGIKTAHRVILLRLLANLSSALCRDMYSLEVPDFFIDDISVPDPDPLAASRYPCVYWIDHLYDSNLRSQADSCSDLQDVRVVNEFLEKKFLYWLEGLSLCKSMAKGVVSMAKLYSLVQGIPDAEELTKLVRDAYRLVMYHKGAIESYPLQIYASALLFSPTESIIRRLFQDEEPKQIVIKPAMRLDWSACLQTLEHHSDNVNSVAFSHDSTKLASASGDHTVMLWDANTGTCLQTFTGHSDNVSSVAFSHDSTKLASASWDNTVMLWDTNKGVCLQILKGHNDYVWSVAFSHDSSWLASASDDRTVKIWDASTNMCLWTLRGHSSSVRSVSVTHNSTKLASASYDTTIKIWDVSSGVCLQTIQGHTDEIRSVAFAHDLTWLGSASYDTTVKVWDVSSSVRLLQTFTGHSNKVSSVAFSHDSTTLASASHDRTIKIWDTRSGVCLQTLEGHNSYVRSVVFSPKSTKLASASLDKTVKIWDTSSGARLHVLDSHSDEVSLVIFSHDLNQLASASVDDTVKIWDVGSGACLKTLKGHRGEVIQAVFLHKSAYLASASLDKTVKIWDINSGVCLRTLGYSTSIRMMDTSHDFTRLAVVSIDKTVKIWNTNTGMCLHTLKGHSSNVRSVAFSHDSTKLASASYDSTVKIWDASSGVCLWTLEGHSGCVRSVAFSHNSMWLASASIDRTIKIWDISSGVCLQTCKGHSDKVSLVAFSQNSTKVASTSYDNTVKIWDTRRGECLWTFSTSRLLYRLSFDRTSPCIHTDMGTITTSGLADGAEISTTESQRSQYLYVALSSDGIWIMYGGEKMLWVPSEYRPSCSSVCGATIGMGVGSGRVWICSIDHPQARVVPSRV